MQELEPSNHSVLFYRDAIHKRQVLFGFLRTMLARGHMAFYVVTDESPETIFQTMLDFGLDMCGLSREGRLKIVNRH